MTIPESALAWAKQIAADKAHGYSQSNRWGPNYDCSSLVISSYKQAGVPIDTNVVNYTGNMSGLLRYGFKDVTNEVNLVTERGLQKGDILWWHKSGTSGHTALYAGNHEIVHARGQSYGSSATGDQGTEIAVTIYYRGSWQHVYRYVGTATAPSVPQKVVEMCPVSVTLPLIMYGSVGSAVKVWQTIVGVTVDGEFGSKTRTATMAWQKARNLKVDGEVGKKSWAAGLNELK